VENISTLVGVNIFVIVLVLLVILTAFAGVKTVLLAAIEANDAPGQNLVEPH
jgi:hypothetical protein